MVGNLFLQIKKSSNICNILSILILSRMTLSKVSFSYFLRNDYLDHFDTFGENFDFDTFKNDTLKVYE